MEPSSGWKPHAKISTMRKRARFLAELRRWFSAREVLEVETPLLGLTTTTDPNINSVRVSTSACADADRFLQPSPEHHMKRLLAAGSGPIFQLCKAFRGDEQGRFHNPEFTMLEWYEPGLDHHGLMEALGQLLRALMRCAPARRISYAELFAEHTGLDPFDDRDVPLQDYARSLGASAGLERAACLDLILSLAIQPRLEGPLFVYDFPADQAALARIRPGDPPVAERFELFIGGVEVANGYHELNDAVEQRRRFEADNATRTARGLPAIPVDEHLLAAIDAGLPSCAGVAVGVDRLVMLAVGEQDLASVLAFPFSRA